MTATLLNFHVPESQRHEGMLLWEWLLRRASELGAHGGSAIRPIANFGRHHVLHEQKFFELAGSLTVQVELLVDEGQTQSLLEQLRGAGIRLLYTACPVEIGILNPDAQDAPNTRS